MDRTLKSEPFEIVPGYSNWIGGGFINLETVQINNLSIENIYAGFCEYCPNLKYINLQDLTHLKSIGEYCFSYCISLESIIFPDSLESIGDYAFEDCVNLKYIKLPDNLKSIGIDAFKYCGTTLNENIISYDRSNYKSNLIIEYKNNQYTANNIIQALSDNGVVLGGSNTLRIFSSVEKLNVGYRTMNFVLCTQYYKNFKFTENKNVLVISCVGELCANSANGIRTLNSCMEIYNNIIPVCIYGSALSLSNGILSNAEAIEYCKKFNYTATPSFGIDMLQFNYNSASDLSSNIYNATTVTPLIQIGCKVEKSINDINLYYICIFIRTINKEYTDTKPTNNKLYIWLVEDDIIYPQYDGGRYNTEYIHNYVFRKNLTHDIFGDELTYSKTATGHEHYYFDNLTYEFNIETDENNIPLYNKENCSVVIFVYDEEHDQVMQTLKLPLLNTNNSFEESSD